VQEHIRFDDTGLHLLDQRLVPGAIEWVHCTDAATSAAAIRDMVIRGAPAIGITAAYGMALAARNDDDLEDAARTLLAARPTAVNLRWAVELLQAQPPGTWATMALALHEEDIGINQAIGTHGTALLPENARVYTHCNAGALATGGWGTALGVARSAWHAGRLSSVYAGETRPYLQGARLTAWECEQEGIPCTLVTDSTAATLFSQGTIDAVVVGADRVAANGDVANKIGTLGLAVMAKHYNIPFYVAVPRSTLDARTPTGADIPIEQRPASEVQGFGAQRWAAHVDVFNPAFDITPAALVTGWITEDGLWRPPPQRLSALG
jgi:methylthioribose-1-phosphate isomerase